MVPFVPLVPMSFNGSLLPGVRMVPMVLGVPLVPMKEYISANITHFRCICFKLELL